jgi:hypothetical protein
VGTLVRLLGGAHKTAVATDTSSRNGGQKKRFTLLQQPREGMLMWQKQVAYSEVEDGDMLR